MGGSSKAKVAVIQASSVVFNAEKTVEKLGIYVKEAAEAGAKLVVFPEAFIAGYPRNLNFGKPGLPDPEGQINYQKYWASSVDIPGPIVTQLENMAKNNRVNLVGGVIERDGNTLYCTVVFFNDEGTFLGKHRKLMPTMLERAVWGMGDGSTMPVFNLPNIGKVGAVICWENYMPLLRMTMYSKGIQIYCAPTADDGDGWLASMRHIAQEGRCFVLACNQFVTKKNYSPDLNVDCNEDIVCRGGSCIVSPWGELLAGPNYTEECILYADIDLNDIAKGKFELDTVGHYARPDVFTLLVNEKKNSNVILTNGEPQKESSLEN